MTTALESEATPVEVIKPGMNFQDWFFEKINQENYLEVKQNTTGIIHAIGDILRSMRTSLSLAVHSTDLSQEIIEQILVQILSRIKGRDRVTSIHNLDFSISDKQSTVFHYEKSPCSWNIPGVDNEAIFNQKQLFWNDRADATLILFPSENALSERSKIRESIELYTNRLILILSMQPTTTHSMLARPQTQTYLDSGYSQIQNLFSTTESKVQPKTTFRDVFPGLKLVETISTPIFALPIPTGIKDFKHEYILCLRAYAR